MPLRTGQQLKVAGLDFELVHAWRLRLAGSINSMAARVEFRRLLDELHAQLAVEQPGRFVVDVRELDLVDSSAIRLFVDWLAKASGRYRVAFRIDPDVTWHRLSFGVLKNLAPDTVELQDEVTGVEPVAAQSLAPR